MVKDLGPCMYKVLLPVGLSDRHHDHFLLPHRTSGPDTGHVGSRGIVDPSVS